ncbi:hypothetical protein C8F01DRAFT_1163908 [Mycena amicta]|nr:hypothetical protein C8F01DRAFT_1163908 [Mycena amicta]
MIATHSEWAWFTSRINSSFSAMSSANSTFYGCWGNSQDAVSTCCRVLGGLSLDLADGSPGCAYNSGSSFKPDDGSGSPNSTSALWATCVTGHFNATSDGKIVITACENTKNSTETVTSTPSATPTAGAFRPKPSAFGRFALGGILVGSGLVHFLTLAL